MQELKIPITKPLFDKNEEKALQEVLRSGWLVQGPRVAEFEDKFKNFTGSRHAIATSSCTTALHLSLLAAGVGPGDEVLIPSFTFIATANAVEYTGARPLLIDIDLETFNIDVKKLRAYLEIHTPDSGFRPRCIIPVSLFGLCANMKAINEIAADYGLVVIEDAACALGAERDNHHAGTEALAGCFSFHPRKAITTGEGGMVITEDDRFAQRVRKMRDHGASKTDLERHLKDGGSLLPEFNTLGFNFRMTDLQGALGSQQMDKADAIIHSRREAAARYDRLLRDVLEVVPPMNPEGYRHSYQSYVCLYKAHPRTLVDPEAIEWPLIHLWNKKRNQIMGSVEESGISVRQGTHAIHTLGYYKEKYGFEDYDFPMSYIADRLSITLPLYYEITDQEQLRIVNSLRTFSEVDV